MICNSGFLLTRKLKELVTGSGSDTQTISSSLPKKPTSVTTLNVKPISSEPINKEINILEENVFSNNSDEFAKEKIEDDSDQKSNHTNGTICNYTSLSLSRSSKNSLSTKSTSTFWSGSLKKCQSKGSKSVSEFRTLPKCEIGAKKTCSTTSLSAAAVVGGLGNDNRICHTQKAGIVDSVASPSADDGSPTGYNELPRKKKKPCTKQNCYTASSTNVMDKDVASGRSENGSVTDQCLTLEGSRKTKPSVLQKFYSLDRRRKQSSCPIGRGEVIKTYVTTFRRQPVSASEENNSPTVKSVASILSSSSYSSSSSSSQSSSSFSSFSSYSSFCRQYSDTTSHNPPPTTALNLPNRESPGSAGKSRMPSASNLSDSQTPELLLVNYSRRPEQGRFEGCQESKDSPKGIPKTQEERKGPLIPRLSPQSLKPKEKEKRPEQSPIHGYPLSHTLPRARK